MRGRLMAWVSLSAVVVGWFALDLCFASDVQATCCPAACAAKHGKQWSRADEILRGCMRGLGCSDSSIDGATVTMRCNCEAFR